MWATLETYKRRGEVSVDFCCRLRVAPHTTADATTADRGLSGRRHKPGRKSARDAERTREWKEARRKHGSSAPVSSSKTAALPVATPAAVNRPALDTGKLTDARSFAEVAAQPSNKATDMPAATAKTVNDELSPSAGPKGPKASGLHPKKRAKTTLAASRVSQRAALLSKKRTAAATSAPATSDSDGEDAAPELLRGTDGERAFNISLVSSPPPPPSPPSLTPPPLTLPLGDTGNSSEGSDTDDSGIEHRTSITEPDFKHEKWVEGHRLNTQDPSWEKVFPCMGPNYCRFCDKKPMAEPVVEGTREYECENCFKMSTFQLVLKFAPRYKYPEK